MTREITHEHEDVGAVGVDPKGLVGAAYGALMAHAAKIDALNIYPVPDGDTGTNMLLTLRSVLEAISALPGVEGEGAARAVSRAALMGARGNSGVILSQILRGACEVLGEAHALDAATVAAALDEAKEKAYAGVREPVEGTMLSVVKDAAAAARSRVAEGEKRALEVLAAAAREAHASVGRTPELLGVLKEAGVVDAGGLGVAVILEGLRAALAGEEPALVDLEEKVTAAGGELLQETVEHSAQEAWGYCTEFVVAGFSGDSRKFETCIHDLGKSVLVIPDGDIVKVHLHTQDPGAALSYAGGFGRLSGVKVDDMEAQTRARAGSPSTPREAVASVGVIAASRGAGNRGLFEAMGAVVVEGGQGVNPSTQDLARAVRSTGAQAVIVLPNNKNVLPAAESVGELVRETEVYVVPTTSVACGLAAMVGYDAEGEPLEVAGEMREIVNGLRCAEVTVAVRDAKVEGKEVRKGEYIGFLYGKLWAVEKSAREVALVMVGEILEEATDVVTLLRGEGLTERDAEEIAGEIRDAGGVDLLVEVKDGGHPLYPLQVAAE